MAINSTRSQMADIVDKSKKQKQQEAAAAAIAAAQERGKALTNAVNQKTAAAAVTPAIGAGLIAGALPNSPTRKAAEVAAAGGSGSGGGSTPAAPSAPVPEGTAGKTAYDLALEQAGALGTMPTYPGAQGTAFDREAPTYAGSFDDQINDLYAQINQRAGFEAPGSFDDQIADLYAQINGRGEFNYDLNGDAFWQQYKDNYTQQAKNAMRDTMGQAAALTGGYGSSYGQAVGQQAYDRRIEDLMDIAPELYDRAYQRYQDEGNRMLQQLNLARDMADDEYAKAYQQYQDEGNRLTEQLNMARQMANDEYGRYQDDYNRYLNDRTYAAQQEAQAYDRYRDQLADWRTERSYADSQVEAAYKKQQDNLSTLQAFMAMGYTPTAQEIADAGLTPAQYQAMATAMMQPASSGGGGSGGLDYIRELQKQANALGANLKVDGVAGKKTLDALKKYGLLDKLDGSSDNTQSSKVQDYQDYLDYLESTGTQKGSQQYQVIYKALQDELKKG